MGVQHVSSEQQWQQFMNESSTFGGQELQQEGLNNDDMNGGGIGDKDELDQSTNGLEKVTPEVIQPKNGIAFGDGQNMQDPILKDQDIQQNYQNNSTQQQLQQQDSNLSTQDKQQFQQQQPFIQQHQNSQQELNHQQQQQRLLQQQETNYSQDKDSPVPTLSPQFQPVELQENMKEIIAMHESGFDSKRVNVDNPLALDQIIDTFDEGSTVFLSREKDSVQNEAKFPQQQRQDPENTSSTTDAQPQMEDEDSDDDDDELFELSAEEQSKLSEQEKEIRNAIKDFREVQKLQEEQVAQEEAEILQFLGQAIRKGWGKDELSGLMQKAMNEVADVEERKVQRELRGLDPSEIEEKDVLEKFMEQQSIIDPYIRDNKIPQQNQQQQEQQQQLHPDFEESIATPTPSPVTDIEKQVGQQQREDQFMYQGDVYTIKEEKFEEEEEQQLEEMSVVKQFELEQKQLYQQQQKANDSDGDVEGGQYGNFTGKTMTIPLK
eukprot:TRINITY_DN72030_c0_g1_i1.p1 TRINITY_DN72030_c0_g1~~TRINITY_DN72030_c0_g1_i1.p1  ORF type:complete len:491 (+),score=106.42 TRINITY_DN72030_c0_g1_i1:1-1473(+)